MIQHLYIHVPFCARICPYCAFHVHRGGGAYQREFAEALVLELAWIREHYPLDLETVYFGGGTPSLLSSDLMTLVCAALPPCRGERTLEVNPKTVTLEKAQMWHQLGFNRISLGAQSFDSTYLKILGRDHTPEEIGQSVQLLRKAGLSNLSIDLMFALPKQPREIWQQTLTHALACQPTHISCYGLTYEEDTPFFHSLSAGAWKKDEEDEIWMFTATEKTLGKAGIPFYEISNFAQPGFESAHNRAYWLGKDYLGCGPSAYSTVGGQRWQNIRDTRLYIEGIRDVPSLRVEQESLTLETRQKERLMFGLRMREGINPGEFNLESAKVTDLLSDGLLVLEEQRLKLTSRGRLVADSIAGLFA